LSHICRPSRVVSVPRAQRSSRRPLLQRKICGPIGLYPIMTPPPPLLSRINFAAGWARASVILAASLLLLVQALCPTLRGQQSGGLLTGEAAKQRVSLRAKRSDRGNPSPQLVCVDCRAPAAPSLAMTDFSHSLSGLFSNVASLLAMTDENGQRV
jgi:hypothetical protein